MATTKGKIVSQIKRLLNGGTPSAPAWQKGPEIAEAVGQVLNGLLKADYYAIKNANGETIPSGYIIASYENVPIVTYRNTAKLTLPAIPINFPNDMGLWFIGPSNIPNSKSNSLVSQWIPIPNGFTALMNNMPLLNTLLGQVGYERQGKDVIFQSDVTAAPNNSTSALVKLIVMDMSQYGDFDLLPITPDMETACIQAVFQMFAGQKPPDRITDPIANNQNIKG